MDHSTRYNLTGTVHQGVPVPVMPRTHYSLLPRGFTSENSPLWDAGFTSPFGPPSHHPLRQTQFYHSSLADVRVWAWGSAEVKQKALVIYSLMPAFYYPGVYQILDLCKAQ